MAKSLLGRLRVPMTSSPYRAALIAVAAVVALAAAGCAGGDPTPTPTAAPAPTPTATPAPTATAPPAPTPTPTPPPAAPATLTPEEADRLFLQITQPEDESIVSTGAVAVQGSTTVDAVVSVNGAVVEVDAQGAFEAIVTLEEGPNLIEVVASDLTGAQESVDIVVVYLP